MKHEQDIRKEKCGVRILGVGVDAFYAVESEDDLQAVVMLIRKAAQLPARTDRTGEQC